MSKLAIRGGGPVRTNSFFPWPCFDDRELRNLVVIEDAAHAIGAVCGGETAGSIGDMATFSFQESKTMTAGEEGIPSHIGYPWPLTRNPMFEEIPPGPKGCPYTCPFYGGSVQIANTHLPVAERICEETVVIPHEVLLSAEADLEDIPRAIEKIQKNALKLLR